MIWYGLADAQTTVCQSTEEKYITVQTRMYRKLQRAIVEMLSRTSTVMVNANVFVLMHPLTSTWPRLNSDVGLEEGQY